MSESAIGARSRRRAPGELTARQREVLELLARRQTNGEIAEKLGISLSAAKWHVSEIIGELGVDTRGEAADWWREQNGLPARLRRSGLVVAGWLSWRPVAMGLAALALIVAAAVVAALLWQGGDDEALPAVDDETPTASPSPTASVATPTASPTPDPFLAYQTYPVAGRNGLFVYTVFAGEESTRDRTWPVRELVVQDLGTGQLVAHWAYSGLDLGYPIGAVLGGEHIVVATEGGLTRYNIDGSGELRLFSPTTPQTIADIAVSPDGRLVAVSSNCYLMCLSENAVTFFDITSGQRVTQVTQSATGFEGFAGDIWEIAWDGDATGVWVLGATYSEGGGSRAFVGLDGSVEAYRPDDWGFSNLSPSGRYVAEGVPQIGCMRIGGRVFRVTDLDTGAVVATVTGETGAYAVWEWSPDSSAVVYQFIPGDIEANCDWAGNEPEYRLLTLATGQSQAVNDMTVLHQSWYGEQFVEVVCPDPAPENPVLTRYGLSSSCKRPGPGETVGDVFVGGAKVASWRTFQDGDPGSGGGFSLVEPVGFLPR
ncbi:MAG TPA: LuxR C-terminal-related transcriptional regulator [Tepidiformaceae bacterium]|nr:LuxR C-terminal-related transcriptional regulator [Tepidiformaceae bacterium]